MSDVTTPTALYYGNNDWFTSAEDLLKVVQGLPNTVPGMIHEVAFPAWNHLDFLWGKDADTLLYSKVINNMRHCWDSKCGMRVRSRDE